MIDFDSHRVVSQLEVFTHLGSVCCNVRGHCHFTCCLSFRPDQEVENTFHLVNILPLVFDERPYFELELEAADNARYPRYDTSRVTISKSMDIYKIDSALFIISSTNRIAICL